MYTDLLMVPRREWNYITAFSSSLYYSPKPPLGPEVIGVINYLKSSIHIHLPRDPGQIFMQQQWALDLGGNIPCHQKTVHGWLAQSWAPMVAVSVFSQAGNLRYLQEDTPARELNCLKDVNKSLWANQMEVACSLAGVVPMQWQNEYGVSFRLGLHRICISGNIFKSLGLKVYIVL